MNFNLSGRSNMSAQSNITSTPTTSGTSSASEPHVQAQQSPTPPTKASRHRFKPQLSCTLCRNRKLKCDRNLPCENCVQRDLSASCTYVHSGLRDKSSNIQKQSNAPRDVQRQIQHLEQLVISLMNQTKNDGSPNSGASHSQVSAGKLPELDPRILERLSDNYAATWPERTVLQESQGPTETLGRICITDDQPAYVGSAHWAAILENIAGLKDSLESSEPQGEEKNGPAAPKGPDLLVGSIPKLTKAQILASIPPRPVVDSLITQYLGTVDMAATMVHGPTFMREYRDFWADPKKTPVMWIGLLFAMMCLSTHFELLSGDSTRNSLAGQALRDSAEAINMFREKTVQCLILGNYTNPVPYTVETLILYYVAEHFRSADTQFGGWMIFGIIVRAAMRLGLHRDASHYPNISVLRAEMQRRQWHAVAHLDLQSSCQVGLPRMIKQGMYDTQQPRNLLDEDFDENSTVLPPARPMKDLTAIGYSLVKHSITAVFGLIVDQANSTTTISYDDVMRLDARLLEVHEGIPEALRVRAVEDLKTGSPDMRVRKFSVDLTYQKARCILHRKFLAPTRSVPTYPHPYSTNCCVDASMRILQSQIFMHHETKPGKLLYSQKWKTSSLMTHDFLLAAMLLCLYLGQRIPDITGQLDNGTSGMQIRWTREDMLYALDGSYQIWEASSLFSKEALKAAKALKKILERLKTASSAQPPKITSSNTQRSPANGYGTSHSESLPHNFQGSSNQPAQAGASHWFSDSTFSSQQQLNRGNVVQTSYEIDDLMTVPTELDWELWDNHVHNSNLIDTPSDLWGFDLNFPLTDSNSSENFMEWGR